jgi:hypothetical protein
MDTQLDKCCTIDYIIFIYYFMIFYYIVLVLVLCIVLHCDLNHIYFMLSDGFCTHVHGFMEGTIKWMNVTIEPRSS